LSFTEQVAKRLHEGACIQKAFNSISDKNTDKGQESVETETTDDMSPTKSTSASHHFATIFCGNSVVTKYHCRLQNNSAITELHPLVIHWFEKEVNDAGSDLHGVSKITVYCEYRRENTCYRAHPNFRHEGPWYDWVMVAYESSDDSIISEESIKNALPFGPNDNPSRIMCFFTINDNVDVYALVHSCNDSTHENDSILFQRWTKEYIDRRHFVEPVLRVVPVDSFVIPILVIEDDNTVYETIPNKGLQGGITVVTPRESQWPSHFLSS